MLLFFVLVASSMMFLSSPAIAATSSVVTVTDENYQIEVIESSKSQPVIVILVGEDVVEDMPTFLEDFRRQVEKLSGDKYKIITGTKQKNQTWVSDTIPLERVNNRVFVFGFKDGELVTLSPVHSYVPDSYLTTAYKCVENQLEKELVPSYLRPYNCRIK
jgi:hypothetical protein